MKHWLTPLRRWTWRTALAALAHRRVVRAYVDAPAGPGRPRRLWVADELVALLTGWAG